MTHLIQTAEKERERENFEGRPSKKTHYKQKNKGKEVRISVDFFSEAIKARRQPSNIYKQILSELKVTVFQKSENQECITIR